MSDLTLTRVAEPSTPAADKLVVFVDTADRRIKTKDDNGVVSVLSETGPRDINILTNGGFAIQQRVAVAATAIPSVSTTTRAGQVADRWGVTTGNVTTTQWTQTDARSSPEAGLVAPYYGRITQLTNAAKWILSQFLANQDIAHLRGGKVRLSVKIKNFAGSNALYRLGLLQLTSAGTLDTSPAFISAIGADGVDPTWGTNLALIAPDSSPTPENGSVSGSRVSVNSTAAWVRSSAVFTIPTDCKNLVAVLYRDTVGAASDSLGVAEFQLTAGPDVIDFVPLPFGFEVMRCQRYFCKTFPMTTVPVASAGAGTGELKWTKVVAGATAGRSPNWQFPVVMFKTPVTITTFNPAAAGAQARDETNNADCTVTTAAGTTDRQTAFTYTGNAATVAEGLIGLHITADCEFVA